MDWLSVWLTLRLACCTTGILFVCGLPFAYWLARSTWRGKFVLEAIVTLPLVLPPTVLGFYLLIATGPNGPIGKAYERIAKVVAPVSNASTSNDGPAQAIQRRSAPMLPFTFAGILLGSVVGNLPFAIRPFVAGFEGMNRRLEEAAWCLGASKIETFLRVTLPLCRPAILSGVILTFAHTVGEFGVVLMLGGNIPGITRTISISIYDDVQALDYTRAGWTSFVLILFSIVVLSTTRLLDRRGNVV